MPGVGQRQAQRPTWDKLRDAFLFGQVTTLTHEWRALMKKRKVDERRSAAARRHRSALARKRQVRRPPDALLRPPARSRPLSCALSRPLAPR